jgi:hypothetical protein
MSEESRAWCEAHEPFIDGQLTEEEASQLFDGDDYLIPMSEQSSQSRESP